VKPFAGGREADVFALDGARILRRYRDGTDTAREVAVMIYLHERGYPVPAVYSAEGPDIVMERLDGPTMATALMTGTMAIADGATMLADLLGRLHEIPGPDGGETVGHFDFHPENVLLTQRGPVVIDWATAQDGPADLDTAMSLLILAQVAISALEHPIQEAAGELLDRFRRQAPGDPTRELDRAVEIRRRNPTMSAAELEALDAAAARAWGAR
jgi:tRNA A-37 threonylcarbamoyl transferase component Bud32